MHNRHSLHRQIRWRWIRILFAVVLLAPIVTVQPATPPPPVHADALSDAVAEQMKLDKLIADQKKLLAGIAAKQVGLQQQMTATQQNIDNVSSDMDTLQSQMDLLQVQVDQVRTSYEGLVTLEGELAAELAKLQAQAQAKQDQLTQRQKVLEARIVAAYQTDQTPLLSQLLTSQSLTDALSDVSYYMDLGSQDKALADQIVEDQKVLAKMQADVAVSKGKVDDLSAQVAGQKQELDTQMAQLSSGKAQLFYLQMSLKAQIAAQQAANDKLAKNKAALAATIKANGAASDALAKKIDQLALQQGGAGRIPSQYNGQLQWPMGGKISQEFGCTGWFSEPRVGSCAHFHQGIDIVAPCLTPVHAAGSGVIVFVGYNPYDPPPKAWLVIIAHSSHMVTWYAHMTGKAPAGIYYGAQVSAGQIIGTENTTGHSTGCHLHWAVRVDGVFKNPRLFV
jgi:murein DD-endopeptidase MepM/ murein hydrolase activator NlpD